MPTRDEYAATIKSGAKTMASESILAALTAEFPVAMAIPLVRGIARVVVEEALDFIIEKGEIGAFFVFIDLRVNQQGRDFYQSVLKRIKAVTPKEKDEATFEMLSAFNRLAVLTS